MPLLFIDYTNLVLKTYEERRDANRLSRLLMHPTTANIRQECLNVYNERIKRGEIEEDILRAFFGVPPVNRGFDFVIERYPADRFRPLRSFIKRRIRNPALVNVELLAWLLDFTPRPFAYAQKMLGITDDPVNLVIDNNGEVCETEMAGDNLQAIKKQFSSEQVLNTEDILRDGQDTIPVAEIAGNSPAKSLIRQKNKLKLAAGCLIITVILVIMYIIQPNKKSRELTLGSKNTRCMYWAMDHYEKISCSEEANGRLILPLDEEMRKNLRMITRPDTITEWSIGKIYYIKDSEDSNRIKCYTGAGNYPEDLNRTLKVLSRHMFDKYLKK
ncbi:MAG: hypothetical protein QM791_05900 [Ferruginibacter sp.]